MKPMKPMKVLLVGPMPPPVGGVSIWMTTFLAASPNHWLESRVVDTSPNASGIPTKSVFSSGRAKEAIRAVRNVRAELRSSSIRPDVVHLHSTWFWSLVRDTAVVLLCRRYRVPTVVHLHVSTQVIDVPGRSGRVFDRLGSLCLRSSDTVVVLSSEVRSKLQSLAPRVSIDLVPNPVDTDRFAPTEKPDGDLVVEVAGPITILFVGRPTREKGFPILAAAISQLDGVRLLMVGTAPEGETTEIEDQRHALLSNLTAQGKLEYVERVDPAEMPAIYRRADVFCLPSQMEGMPISLLEALASGLPVIATMVGGVVDIAALAGDDLLISMPVDDERALSAALSSLRDDPHRRSELGRRGRAAAVSVASTTTVMSTYRSMYERITKLS
jgi:glycosyltransferase involved in cell wall biosynthesis